MKPKNLDVMSNEELAELYFALSSISLEYAQTETVTMLTTIMEKASKDADLANKLAIMDNKLNNLSF